MREMPPLARRRSWLINLGLMLGAVGVYLAGQSLVRQFVHQKPQSLPSPTDAPYRLQFSGDPELTDVLVPGFGVANEAGYAGPAYPVERAPGAFRVLGLGDSITMGYGSTEAQGYFGQLRHRMEGEFGPGRAEAINLAVTGFGTRQEVRMLEVRGLAYKPDLIILGYCLNDWIDVPITVREAGGALRFQWVDPDHLDVFGMMKGALSEQSSDEFFRKSFERPLWKSSEAALARLAALGKARHVPVVVVIFPMFLDWAHYPFERFHERLAQTVIADGMDVLDLLPVYRQAGPATDFAPGAEIEFIHPTVRGHTVAANALYDHLSAKGLLPRSDGAAPGTTGLER